MLRQPDLSDPASSIHFVSCKIKLTTKLWKTLFERYRNTSHIPVSQRVYYIYCFDDLFEIIIATKASTILQCKLTCILLSTKITLRSYKYGSIHLKESHLRGFELQISQMRNRNNYWTRAFFIPATPLSEHYILYHISRSFVRPIADLTTSDSF